MTSATDIITYIGVPLAVFGVMPLIWNMMKSFFIRHRLLANIPAGVRRFFTIIMDPASGTVSVALKSIFIDSGSLLGYDITGPDPVVEAVENLLPESWTGVEFDNKALENARQKSTRGLFSREDFSVPLLPPPAASWMPLSNSYLAVHKKPESSLRVQYAVDSSLVCPPTLLESKWSTFVYFALGLGVSPHHGLATLGETLRKKLPIVYPIRLCDQQNQAVMVVSIEGGKITSSLSSGGHTFSLHRALAWESIMVTQSHGDLCFYFLWTGHTLKPSEIVAFSQEGAAFWHAQPDGHHVLSTFLNQIPLPKERWTRSKRQDSNYLPEEGFRAEEYRMGDWHKALTWTIYAQEHYYKTKEWLPATSMIILRAKQSIAMLKEMDALKRDASITAAFQNHLAAELTTTYLCTTFQDIIAKRFFLYTPQDEASTKRSHWLLALPPYDSRITFGSVDCMADRMASENQEKVWSFLRTTNSFKELSDLCRPGCLKELDFDMEDLESPKTFVAHLVLAVSLVGALPFQDAFSGRPTWEVPSKLALRTVLPEKGPLILDSIYLA
ncbi:hypothetical protein BKA61DRAFT_734947 [Leptodontidium sp. MPI-SDFR-AT-0119]|nr:hypothetical protein BKA61DRAFT_734947 [Leptodontidium sp. MPI-SDFR-AT-0119]